MNKANFISTVSVVDPSDMSEVEVKIFKHQNGKMFGLDNNYIDQELEENFEITIDPFDANETVLLVI